MKLVLTIFVFLGATLPSPAFAGSDAPSAGPPRPASKPVRTGRKARSVTTGTCEFVPSPSNPLGGPCVDLVLVARDGSGDEIRVRTSADGRFEFLSSTTRKYRIESGSRSYGVVSPTEPIRGGTRVELKLRQE